MASPVLSVPFNPGPQYGTDNGWEYLHTQWRLHVVEGDIDIHRLLVYAVVPSTR